MRTQNWLALSLLVCARVNADPCEPSSIDRITNHFFFQASSDEGAPGDVVAIDLSLTMRDLVAVIDGVPVKPYGFVLTGCYDASALELLDMVDYSETFQRVGFFYNFYTFPAQQDYQVIGNFKVKDFAQTAVPLEPIPLATLYFRLHAMSGTTTQLQFCDNVLAGRGCSSNWLQCQNPEEGANFNTRSISHGTGFVRVIAGEPTHPDPPPLPPNARVYEEAPTAETAEIHFELEGPLLTHPGAIDVPFDLFVTSNFEFSAFMTSLTFPADYLELTHIDEHTKPGVVSIDNAAGTLGVLMTSAKRRVGGEGERVHLATVHFDVKESASSASSLHLNLEPVGNYFNWLGIQYRHGVSTDALPTTSQVTPLLVTQAIVNVRTEPTPVGDVNLDRHLDLSDAVAILAYLFQSAGIPCPEAADFNEDSRTNLSDAVSILAALFFGGSSPAGEVFCGG